MADENPVEVENVEPDFPEWYIKNYEALERFLQMNQEARNDLVGEASGCFGTILSALTPEGQSAVIQSGKAFLDTNLEAMGEKFAGVPREILLYLMLGVAVEAIGVQQMKIQEAKAE
jgi:hypothetical protein